MATPRKTTATAPRKPTARKATSEAAQLIAKNAQRMSARAWVQHGEEIELPSGNVALLRRPGPEMFMSGGKVPDALSALLDESIREKRGLPPEKAAEIAKNAEQLTATLDMMDSVLVSAVIEPTVKPNPTCIVPIGEDGALCGETPSGQSHSGPKSHMFVGGNALLFEERDPEFVYCAEVDFMDKQFIFNYAVGGTRDVERFRQEYEELLGSI